MVVDEIRQTANYVLLYAEKLSGAEYLLQGFHVGYLLGN